MRFVITGSNRGIGLELVRQALGAGHDVDATARRPAEAQALTALAAAHPGHLRVHALDTTDSASVAAFQSALGDGAIDVLINNAGVFGVRSDLAHLDFADIAQTLDTNAFGPLRVTAALLPHLRRGSTKKVVHITSGMGSITDNTSGGAYGYRMSKAALNMACRSMAVELRREGFTAVVVNPGWVQTDMGGASAPTPVAESAEKILALVLRIGPADSGTFLDYRGHTWPW